MGELLTTFLAAFRAGAPAATACDAALAALWDRARAAWPAIVVAPDGFAAHLAAVLDGAGDDAALAQVHAGDLYLALAACGGDRAALAAVDALLAPLREALIRRGRGAAIVDDAIQTVRCRLLVTSPERTARLATYRGRGTLAGWLRVVVVRAAHELAGPSREASDRALAAAAVTIDPVLAILVRDHGDAVRAIVRDAVAGLDERQRSLLRLEIVERLPHQRIAELHGVHRTTALRWLEDGREALARAVRQRLRATLALGEASADSLLRALVGQIELSLASLVDA